MAGYASTDNGYAIFDHVRIPRDNMLSKFAQVTEDGQYVQPPHAKLSYGGVSYYVFDVIITLWADLPLAWRCFTFAQGEFPF